MSPYVHQATNATNIPTSWHIGLTPSFPSSILLSDNAAIESLLSDIPLLAIGLLAFAALTFLLVVRRFDARMIPLFLSPLFAFVAVVLDVDQLLVENSPGTPNTLAAVPLSSVLPLLIAREVFLAISIGMRFLYFWVYVTYLSGRDPQGLSRSLRTNHTLNAEESNFLRLEDNNSSVRVAHPSSTSKQLKWFSIPFTLSFLFLLFFRYTLLVATLLIPVLQLLWRLIKEFNRHGGVYVVESAIEIGVSVVLIATLSLRMWFAEGDKGSRENLKSGSGTTVMNGGNGNFCIDRLDLGQEKQEKWNALKRDIPVLISVLVGLSTGIGNLICFEFSESSLGRLLQALELYILVLYVLISVFYQSRSKADQLSVEDDRLHIIGSKEQNTTIDERTPASRSSFNVQPGTGSLLPISMPSPQPRRSAHLSSWLTSINTSRDSDVNNASMSSTPGSSILSPSSSNQKASGGVSSLLYYYAERARSLKSRSGLLNSVGGRIRSVSWDMFNPAFGEKKVEKDDENGMPIDTSNDLFEKHGQHRESHPSQPQATTPVLQTSKIPIPPLASRLERLAMQLDFMPSSSLTPKNGQTKGETMNALSPGPTGRLSVLIPMSNPNEFRLTPITHNALQLDRLSYYYEPDANSNYPDPATYSLWHSDSYTKSVQSSASSSIAGFETFLSQQQAELNTSVAELGLFKSGLLNNGEDGDDLVGGSQKDSLASDFSFSRFPEPPTTLDLERDAETGESAFVELVVGTEGQGNYPGASTTLLETIGPAYPNSASLRSPSSFPAPIKRTSGDSSVLGMNEGALTLGLGLGIDGIVTREELGTSSQFDVTSFIATGGGRIDSSQSHIRSPHLEAERYRPSSSDVGDGDGNDDGTITPTRSVVRFATVIRVPPVVSAPAKQRIPSQFSFGSQKDDVSNAIKTDSILNTPEVAPVSTNVLTTTTGLVARPGQTSVSGIRQTHRKKIGLPSRVKLDIGDPTPHSLTK